MPIPWAGDQPPFGFGPGHAQPWIPQPLDWGRLTVEAQEKVGAESTLAFYRRALAARREHALGSGDTVDVLTADAGVLALQRGGLTVVLNTGPEAVELPAGEVLIASGEVTDGLLPPDTAVWLA